MRKAFGWSAIGAGLAMAGLIAGGQPVLAKKAPPPAVTVAKPEGIKGMQSAMLAGFTLVFVTERKDSAQAGGGLFGSGYGGRSTARSTLAGLSPLQYQAIADAAYADFTAKLTAAGITLADREPLLVTSRGMTFKPMTSPQQASIYFGEDTAAKAHIVGAAAIGTSSILASERLLTTGLGNLSMSMTAGMNETVLQQRAKETGMPVLNVTYVIDFADTEKYGGFARSWSSVSVRSGLAVVPAASRITILSPSGKASVIALGQPIALNGDFGQMRDAMSGGEKTMQTVGNVIGILGGVGTNKTSKWVLDVQPDLYARGVGEATAEANDKLIGQIVALR